MSSVKLVVLVIRWQRPCPIHSFASSTQLLGKVRYADDFNFEHIIICIYVRIFVTTLKVIGNLIVIIVVLSVRSLYIRNISTE